MKRPSTRQVEPRHHPREEFRGAAGSIVAAVDERARRTAMAFDVVAVVAQSPEAKHILDGQPNDAGNRITGYRAQDHDWPTRHANSPAASGADSGRRRSLCRVCTS